LSYIVWQRRALKHARILDQAINFDLIHHVSWGSLQLGSNLWRLGKPFFFGPVGGGQTAPSQMKEYFGSAWRQEALRTFVVHRLSAGAFGAGRTVRNATTVLVTNDETERLVRNMGAKDTRFMWASSIPEEILRSASDLSDGTATAPLKLIWVGGLLPRKGVCLALDALAKLLTTTQTTLTIVGDGPDRSNMEQRIKELGLTEVVNVLGSRSWREVIGLYDSHDALLFTSLRDSDGMQLFEAMARGCTVVCLDHHGATRLINQSNGIRVPVSTPIQTAAGLADELSKLAADHPRLRQLKLGALKAAQELTWEAKIEVAKALYHEKIGSPGHQRLQEAKEQTRRDDI
jgi:glycosyltransferase involved in cell wall biosynthesis